MLYVLGSCRVAFPLLQWRSFLTSQLSTKVLTILGNTSLEKTPLTAASYNIALSSHKWKCRKEPAAQQRSFSNYPRGYWGATVIACDAETEEWVLRFDEAYGDLWDAGWRFDDPPESDLQFQRTRREMVFCGEIEEDDDMPIYVPKKE
jgi:hypothetical protein